MEKNKILVPIDFQDQSIYALEYAVKVANSIHAKISCLYVIEEPGYITGLNLTKETQDKIRRDAEVKLSEVANKVLKNERIPFEIIVTKGKAYKRIVNTARDLKARFIIMGKSDSSDFKKNISGTNTNHIIASSNIPVITVRNNKHLSDDHLLLPLDLTKQVRSKVEKAIEIAEVLNARVTVVSVLEKDWVSIKLKFQKKLHEIKTIIENQNIICNTQLIEAKAPVCNVINEYANKINADLIFLMTQQEIDFVDYFVGSIAQDIINKSELPVLSVIPNVERTELLSSSILKHLAYPINLYNNNNKKD